MTTPTNPVVAPAGGGRSGPGVIHDIGYRHYQGVRLGRWMLVRVLFLDSLRAAYGLGRSARSKVMPLGLFALMCLPALVIAIVMNASNTDSVPSAYHSYALNLEVVVALFLASQAPASVSRDLRFRVMSLYLSRPLRRGDYVLAKVAALAAAVFLLIGVPLTIMLAGALLAERPVLDQLRNYGAALVGAAVLALVLSGIGLMIAAVTPRRGLGVAAIITVLMLSISVAALAQAVAESRGAHDAAGYLGLLSPFSLVQGVQTSLLHSDNPLPAGPPGALGGLVFAVTTVLVVAACLGGLGLRYRKVSVS